MSLECPGEVQLGGALHNLVSCQMQERLLLEANYRSFTLNSPSFSYFDIHFSFVQEFIREEKLKYSSLFNLMIIYWMPIMDQVECKALYIRDCTSSSEPHHEAGILLDEETESQQLQST